MPTIQNLVHPYLPNTNETQVATIPGATYLAVAFSALTETEQGYDFIYVLDGLGNQIGPAHSGTDLAGAVIYVPGDTVQIHLTSDYDIQFYGYLAVVTDATPTITINKAVIPPADPGLFNLQIDGVTQAADQGDGGTTGPVPVAVGAHTVGEIAGTGTSLANYISVISGDAAPDGSILIGPPTTPSLVHVSATDVIRSAEQEVENALQSSRDGPWRYGTDLYLVGQTGYGGAGGFIVVYKSTDNGVTWAEVDAANHPPCGGNDAITGPPWLREHLRTFNVARSGVDRSGSILYVVYSAPGSGLAPGFLAMAAFDLAAESWGVPFVSAIDVNVNVGFGQTFTQPHLNLEYRNQNNTLIALNYNQIYQITPAGVFTYLGAFAVANPGDGCGYTTCLSHSGVNEWVHCFTGTHLTVAEIWLRHQSIALNNSISPPQDILRTGGSNVPAGFMGSTTPGPPVQLLDALEIVLDSYADGTDVVCPYMTRLYYVLGQAPVASDLVAVGQLVRGTPAASPVWSVEEFYRTTGGTAFFNGASVTRNSQTGRLVLVRNNWSVSDSLISCENSAGSVWGPDQTIYGGDGTTTWQCICVVADPGSSLGYALRVGHGNFGGSMSPDNSDIISMWVFCGGPAPAQVVIITNTRAAMVSCSITITAPPPATRLPGPGGSRRIVVLVPNKFDYCLREEIHRMGLVEWGRPHCCVPPIPDIYFNWIKEPHEGTYFRRVGSIPTPLPIDGDQLVLTYRSPLGYDGVVRGIFHRYTGPGFRDGGGDIIWRLMLQNIYAKHMGAITVQMGQIGQPYAIRDGIPFTSNRSIRYYVNVPNLSGGILPVNSRIVCGIEGWIWPRR